ncbi:MAG: CoA-binding protein [Promethearchaeota archaeon]
MSNSLDTYHDLERLFNPRGVGIIGVGPNPSGAGYFARIMEGKIKVPMYFFNPKYAGQELLGQKCYSSILDEELKNKPIDYVILGVKAGLCPQILEEIGQKGSKFVTIFASGFSEVGNEGLESQVLEIATKYNMRIIGPNCIGLYAPYMGIYNGGDQSRKTGNFSATFQSGGLAVNSAQLAVSYGVYVAQMISIGNAIDLGHPDFLEYFLHDPRTRIIGLYLEHLKNIEEGHKFIKITKECNLNRKPVILWRAGYGDATKKAIISHTGGLAGSNAIWKAVAKQTGCSLVKNSTEMAALASAFKFTSLPASRRIGLIGIGGGSTIEAGDALEKYNIQIPRLTDKTINKFARFLPDVNTNFVNPLDLGAQGAYPNIYAKVLSILDRDPNIDAIVFVKDPERFASLQDTMLAESGMKVDLNKMFIQFVRKTRKKYGNKPLYCVMLKINEGFQEYKSRYSFKLKLLNSGIPVFESFDLVGKVLNHLNNYREFLEKHGKWKPPKNNGE